MNEKITINDKVIRIIGIQFFGIVIPNATGLISNADREVGYLMLAYAYFMLIAFLIWQGNRFFLFKLQGRFNWFIHPLQKIVVLLAMNIFYTSPLVIGMLLGWFYYNNLPADWYIIQITTVTCVVCVIFVTHVYETVFLIKQRESDLVKSEQLERAKAQAELEALKNQIDPHFMFNSLNSLSYLIEHDAKKATLFTESLAEVYRYILANKDQTLVILDDELDFLERYIALLKLRFEKALTIDFNFKPSLRNDYLIPPISIFIALENVVKHNEISIAQPLKVAFDSKENWLSIKNRKTSKKNLIHSSKIGLKNLDERFKMIVGDGIKVNNAEHLFELQLPMLKLNV